MSATREKRPFYLKARSPTAPSCQQRRAASAGQGWVAARITPEPAATAGSCLGRAEPGRGGDTPVRRQRGKRPSPMRGSPAPPPPAPASPSLPPPGRNPRARLTRSCRDAPPRVRRRRHFRFRVARGPGLPESLAAAGGAAWRRGGSHSSGTWGLRSPGKRRQQGCSVCWAEHTPGVRTAGAHCMAVFPLAQNQFGGK